MSQEQVCRRPNFGSGQAADWCLYAQRKGRVSGTFTHELECLLSAKSAGQSSRAIIRQIRSIIHSSVCTVVLHKRTQKPSHSLLGAQKVAFGDVPLQS